ncbi:MAG TPA: amidase family protein [Caulobacteraceae bacterium]|nr:amidase family protein [Caulobacteraceae bacterium]
MTAADIDDVAVTAGELVEALAARKVGALELADAAIARIERLDGPINAVVVRDFDRARDAAKAADAALARGERRPLLGLPMTVKEAHNIAGLPTTWGSPMFQGWEPEIDALGVSRLKAAGAVILGKTNVPPFLSDWQSNNPIYGRTNNPWDTSRTAGGSSGGGAAALAAGFTALEFGSDIGGSIRVPAAFCGVFGHKPSHGIIPSRGHAPPGIDGGDIPLAVIGPMARSAADLGLALDVLAGPPPEEAVAYRLVLPPSRGRSFSDFRVLMLTQHPAAPVDHEILAALDELASRLEASGAKVSRHSPLVPDLAAAHSVYMSILGPLMSPPEALMADDAPRVGAWLQAHHAQTLIRRAWAALFETVDVVIAPSLGVVAFPHDDSPDMQARTLSVNGEPSPYFSQLAWPGMATLANLPATAAPIGRTKGGLPIGAQFIGPYLEDRTTIAFAGLVEQAFDGFTPPPGY